MLTLIESRRRAQRTAGGTVTSIVVHAALISGAVFVTAQAKELPVYGPPEHPIPLRPLSKPTTSAKHPHGGHGVASAPRTPTFPREPGMNFRIPDSLPPIDSTPLASGRAADSALFGARGDGDDGATGSTLGGPYIASQVDKPAMALGDNPPPRYPSMLEQSRVEGDVLAQFVVDTTGRAEMPTFTIVRSTNESFADALRAVVPRWRFFPAEAGGHRVRQLVEMPVRFVAPRPR